MLLQTAAIYRKFICSIVKSLAFSSHGWTAETLCSRRQPLDPGVLPQHINKSETRSRKTNEVHAEFRPFDELCYAAGSRSVLYT